VVIIQPVQASDLHGTAKVPIGQNLDLAQILYLLPMLCRAARKANTASSVLGFKDKSSQRWQIKDFDIKSIRNP